MKKYYKIIKSLENKKRILFKNKEYKKAGIVEKMILNIKELGIFKAIDYHKQKKLFFLDHYDPIKDVVVKTQLKCCRECGEFFPSPHSTTQPKCILCKIKGGNMDEARRDLELYTISDLAKRNLEIEKEKQRLSKLPTHEIAEMGEERGLWKQKEKQKRLI